MNWTAPANGGSAITGYTVEVSSNGGESWSDAPGACAPATTEASTATSCVASPLNPGAGYVFRVRAINAIDPSSFSAASGTVVVLAATPDAPTDADAAAGNQSAQVSWTAPINDGGATITSYTVTGSPTGSCTVAAPATSCDVTGLSNDLSYTFTVVATNSAGDSAPSAATDPVSPQRDASTTAIVGTTASLNSGTRARTNESFTVNFTVSSVDATGVADGGTVTVEAQTSGGTVVASCSGAATAGVGSCALSGLKPSDNVARLVASLAQTPRLLASQSAPFAFDVTRSNTTSTLSSNSPSRFGQDIVLSATFNATAPGANPVTGTARFVRQPGNVTIVEVPIVPGIEGAPSTATTTITTNPDVSLSPITYNVVILDNADFIGSNNNTVHTVLRAETALTINSITPALGPNIEVNETVTVTATVAAILPGEGTPNGTVQVRGTGSDAAATTGCDISLSGGTGSCELSFSTKGGATLVFSYVESANFAASSNSQAVTVLGLPVVMTLSPPMDAPYFGNSYDVGYSLTGGAGDFEGEVSLTSTGPSNATATCVSTSAPANNTGVCTFAGGQAVGPYTLDGAYAGDSQDLPATATANRSIQQATTELTVTTTPSSSAAGAPVSFGVVLTRTNGSGALDGEIVITADGLVDELGPAAGCTLEVDAATSPFVDSCTLAFTQFGANQLVTAVFTPTSTNFAGDTATALHNVTSAQTTPDIGEVEPFAPQVGDDISFNFSINGCVGPCDGDVQVSVNGGAPVLCSFTRASGEGSCTAPASSFQTIGEYSLLLEFVPDDIDVNDAASSDTVLVNVTRRETVADISAPVNPVQAGVAATFNISVSAEGGDFFAAGTIPDGQARICAEANCSGGDLCASPIVLTGSAGNTGGSCQITFANVTTRTLHLVYDGNTNFVGASDSISFETTPRDTTIAITRVSSFTSGVSPAATALVGEQVTVVFDVDGGFGEYEGSVTVYADGPGVLEATCASTNFNIETGVGSCTFSVGGLNGLEQVGIWSFSADFIPAPGSNDRESSTTLPASIEILQASTTLVLSSSPAPSVFGQPFTLTATVTATPPSEGFPTGNVNFFDGESNAIGVVALTATATPGVSSASIPNLTRNVALPNGWRFVAATITNPNFAGANDFGYDHLVNRDNQTVAVTAPGTLPFDPGGSFNVSALATAVFTNAPSGQAVELSAGPAGVCSGSGSSSGNPGSNVSISILGGGTCVITASVPQSQNYNAVAPQTLNVEITPIDQTISFDPLPNRPAADGTFELVATSDSGLTVSFDSTTMAVCTVSGTTVSYVGAGTCSITASQAGNASYNPAVPVTQSFIYVAVTVTPATLPDGTRGTAYSETLSASGFGAEAPFVFSVSSGTLPAGITLTGDTLGGNPTTPGDYTFTIRATASNSGPGNLGSPYFGEQEYTVNIARQAQTITFGALPDRLLSASPFTVTATADSGLVVSFASGTAGVCAVAGDQVTLLAAGTCTITASQGGDANYEPADDVVRSFEVRDAVVITTDSPLANGVHQVAYGPLQFAATGGNGSYEFEVTGGALPSGMSLSLAGELSGTPSGANTYNFEITATDNSGPDGPFSGSKDFVLVIDRAELELGFVAPTPASVTYSDGGFFGVAVAGNNVTGLVFAAGPVEVCQVDGLDNARINLIGVGAGTCTVTATVVADDDFEGGLISTNVTVDPATPNVGLVIDPTASTSPNDPVTLTATVTGTGAPTGTVSFRRNGVDIVGCVDVALVAGEAECTTTTLPQGTNLLTARYNGDANNNAVVSNEVSQVVRTGTSIALNAGNLTEARFGQAVTVGFTVSDGVAPYEGVVTVTATPPAPGVAVSCTGFAGAGGVGSCVLPALATTGPVLADGYVITASYAGDNDDGASNTTVSQTLNVLRSNTNTALTIAPVTSSPFGQAFTLTATVTAVAPGGGVPPGTIVFLRDGESIGEVPLVGGVATFNVAGGLPVGNYVFRAEYAQTTNYLQSFENRNYAVTAKATTTTITGASANPSALSAEVVFSYTVTTSPADTTPTGNVTLTASTGETCTATVAAGSCPITFATAGERTLTAAYAGDSQHAPSTSAAFSQTVNQGSTEAVLDISPVSPAQIGQPVSFDVTVTGTPGSPLPTGTVSVVHGMGTEICSFTLPAAGCQVTFSTEQNFSDVRAVYAGDSNFTGATSNIVASYVVEKVPTSIVFVTADSTITFGDSIAIATTVSGGINGNLGLVTVTATAIDKAPVSCSAAASAGTCTLVGLEAATWSVSASYEGDADDQASSTAEPITVTVNKAEQVGFVVTATPDEIAFGEFSTIATAGGNGDGAVTLAVTDGAANCSLVDDQLEGTAVGTCTVTATKAESDNYLEAIATVDVTVVRAEQDELVIVANPTTIAFGETSLITASGGTGSGAISFAVDVDSAAICSIASGDPGEATVTATGVGACVVNVSKDGGANYEDQTGSVTVTVIRAEQDDLVVVADPASIVFEGSSLITVTGGNGDGAISFAVDASSAAVCTVAAGDPGEATATAIGVGSCLVNVTKAGDDNYEPQSGSVTIAVGKAEQAELIVAADPATIVYLGTSTLSTTGGSGPGAVTYAVTGGTGVCSIDGSTLTGDGVGTCEVTATKAGGDNYEDQTGTVTVTVNQAPQAPLTVTATPQTILVGGTSTLAATGGSGTGTEITFELIEGATVCLLSGNTITGDAVGTCTVEATKAGDANYLPVTGEVVITVNPATIDLSIVKTGRYTIGGIVWELLVSNAGPGIATGATVLDALPAEVVNATATWSCATNSGGGTCVTAGGTGDVDVDVNLPANSSVVITITATLIGTPASVSNTAEVIPPDGITDTNLANNTSTLDLPVALFSNGFEGDPLLVGELKSLGGTVALDGALLETLLEGHKAINAARYWAGEQQLQLQVREVRGLVEVRLLQASAKQGLTSTRWIELWPGDVVRIDYAKSGGDLDSQLAVGPGH